VNVKSRSNIPPQNLWWSVHQMILERVFPWTLDHLDHNDEDIEELYLQKIFIAQMQFIKRILVFFASNLLLVTVYLLLLAFFCGL